MTFSCRTLSDILKNKVSCRLVPSATAQMGQISSAWSLLQQSVPKSGSPTDPSSGKSTEKKNAARVQAYIPQTGDWIELWGRQHHALSACHVSQTGPELFLQCSRADYCAEGEHCH